MIDRLKKEGWGVLADEHRYRFIRFDEETQSDVRRTLENIDCHPNDWASYRLGFPSIEAAKAVVESAEWSTDVSLG